MSTSLRSYYRGHNLVAMRHANQSQYYHFDHQGTTQCLTDGTGAVTDRFASDAWGVQVKRTGSSINRQWYVGSWGYYREDDLRRLYVRSRALAVRLGAWTRRDPFPDEPPYQYVWNQPSRTLDPSGYQSCDDLRCCCEIESIDFDVKSIPANDPHEGGHKLTLTVKFKNRPLGRREAEIGCRLTWLEKLYDSQSAKLPSGEWFDVADYQSIFAQNPGADFELQQSKDCPSSTITFNHVDKPGYLKPLKKKDKIDQRLCIRIEVFDGCKEETTVKTFMQRISIRNGKVVALNPPNMPPWMAAYCQYNGV